MKLAFVIVERELRRFRRSPMLIVMSLIMPLLQLVVLGYAFGGKVRHLQVGFVNQDHGLPALKLRELANAISANAQTFELVPYNDPGEALTALRNGRLSGVVQVPPDFSRRALAGEQPRVALIEDNTDTFVSATLDATMGGLLRAYNDKPDAHRIASDPALESVEIYPFVPYIQYLLPGSIVMSIFMMVMIGGGIIYMDDKMRGLHEGYLVTPITRFELILGFNLSGAIKAMIAGLVLMTVGSVIAGVPDAFDPMKLMRVFVVIAATSVALVSMMFLVVVRMNDPMMPRAIFGMLNTLLYFPSGAVYPQQAFPGWMRVIAKVDPFTYSVHALKSLLLKNTGFEAIMPDLIYLSLFAGVAMGAATLLFKREL